VSNSTPVFIDTAFVFALINQRDDWHDRAVHWSRLLETERSPLLTTDFILMEIGDGLAAVHSRQHAAQVIQTFRTSAFIEIVPASRSLIEDALLMYQTRADKDWGMTDCSSLVVMQERGITDALTVDRHFQQAGFALLLEA
jgi:predicted nucleic acid-binding protein